MVFLYTFFFKLFARIAFGNQPGMVLPEHGDEPVETAANKDDDEMQRHH